MRFLFKDSNFSLKLIDFRGIFLPERHGDTEFIKNN